MSPSLFIVCAVLVAALSADFGAAALAPIVLPSTLKGYSVLAESSVSTSPVSTITNLIGVTPGTSITGFAAADSTHTGSEASVVQAHTDLASLNQTLLNAPCDVTLSNQNLGGMTLTGKVYCFDGTADLTGHLYLADGDTQSNVFLFRIGSSLNVADHAIVTGGSGCNVFWQIGTAAVIGVDVAMIGTIHAGAEITMATGSTLLGHAFAGTAVSLQANAITSNTVCTTAPTCSDGIKNGNETGIDCGFASGCGLCTTGKGCALARDCSSSVCGTNSLCAAPACTDGVKNGNETGIDCGFSSGCGLCAQGKGCALPKDCSSNVCNATSQCAKASCTDGIKNNAEVGVDCGFSSGCGLCAQGKGCALARDCSSAVCNSSLICSGASVLAPTCTNGVLDAPETAIDCGFESGCGLCADSKTCSLERDCGSGVCTSLVCAAPSCSDAIKNGDEVSVDCGFASGCGLCARGKSCALSNDCSTGFCDSSLVCACTTAHCSAAFSAAPAAFTMILALMLSLGMIMTQL